VFLSPISQESVFTRNKLRQEKYDPAPCRKKLLEKEGQIPGVKIMDLNEPP